MYTLAEAWCQVPAALRQRSASSSDRRTPAEAWAWLNIKTLRRVGTMIQVGMIGRICRSLRDAGLLIAVIALLAVTSPAQASTLTVTALQLNGAPVEQAADVLIRQSGEATAQRQLLARGQILQAGTELTAPRSLTIELTTANSNRITLYPGAKFVAAVITDQGESHVPLSGRIAVDVRKALSFFNLSYDRITAGVKGTVFVVDVDLAKSFGIEVTEGVVEVERSVRVQISGGNSRQTVEADNIRVAEDIKAGQSRTYSLSVDEYLSRFNTYADAEAYFRDALAQAQSSGDPRRVLRALQNLMEILWRLGKDSLVSRYEASCVELARATRNSEGEAECLNKAGIALGGVSQHQAAIDRFDRALVIRERLYRMGDHPSTSTLLHNLGTQFHALSLYPRAIAYLTKSVEMKARLYGNRDMESIAESMCSLGSAHRAIAQFDQAQIYIEKGLAIAQRASGNKPTPAVISCTGAAGAMAFDRRDYRTSISYSERAHAMMLVLYGNRDHPEIVRSLVNLATAAEKLGDYTRANSYLESALEMGERIYEGRDHELVAVILNDLGWVQHRLGQELKALSYHRRALEIRQRVDGGRNRQAIATSLMNLGLSYAVLRDPQQALVFHEKAMQELQRLYGGKDHPLLVVAFNSVARDYGSLGQYARSVPYMTSAIEMFDRLFPGRNDTDIQLALAYLAELHRRLGNAQQASAYAQRAEAMRSALRAAPK